MIKMSKNYKIDYETFLILGRGKINIMGGGGLKYHSYLPKKS
jgi:hypothetical protein